MKVSLAVYLGYVYSMKVNPCNDKVLLILYIICLEQEEDEPITQVPNTVETYERDPTLVNQDGKDPLT